MPTLETLQVKRAALTSQLEQFIGQINRINGAVAVLDELIGEAAKEAPRNLSVIDVIRKAQEERAREEVAPQWTQDGPPRFVPAVDASWPEDVTEDAPEMLPVLPYEAPAEDAA